MQFDLHFQKKNMNFSSSGTFFACFDALKS